MLLFGRDALVAEHQDVMVEMGAVDAREIGVAQRRAQVEAEDFGAQRRVEGADVQLSRNSHARVVGKKKGEA